MCVEGGGRFILCGLKYKCVVMCLFTIIFIFYLKKVQKVFKDLRTVTESDFVYFLIQPTDLFYTCDGKVMLTDKFLLFIPSSSLSRIFFFPPSS